MSEKYTVTQVQRLTELNADKEAEDLEFKDKKERDDDFRKREKEFTSMNRAKISGFLEEGHLPLSLDIENKITEWLTCERFSKVMTPVMIPGEYLDKMTITEDKDLRQQVFWTGRNKCLRPMLAPNLYIVMRELHKITGEPVRIFECGPCFRKESQGAMHMNEFTMLNLVELAGTEKGQQAERLKTFASGVMDAAGIEDYEIVHEKSEVYGETLDIVSGGVELASGAFGPLPMDNQWGVYDKWVGLGLGIERIAMVKGGYRTIKRVGRNTTYIDGISLKL